MSTCPAAIENEDFHQVSEAGGGALREQVLELVDRDVAVLRADVEFLAMASEVDEDGSIAVRQGHGSQLSIHSQDLHLVRLLKKGGRGSGVVGVNQKPSVGLCSFSLFAT